MRFVEYPNASGSQVRGPSQTSSRPWPTSLGMPPLEHAPSLLVTFKGCQLKNGGNGITGKAIPATLQLPGSWNPFLGFVTLSVSRGPSLKLQ